VVVVLTSACTRASSSSPAAPGDVAVPRIPVIVCPSNPTSQSFNGFPVAVTFAPNASGVQPLNVTCTPASGTSFAIGTTNVTCAAADPQQHQTSCNFSVRIFGPPQVAVTKFLAFGDSITYGSQPPDSIDSYPPRLQRKLAGRYITQTLSVINDGSPGENASGRGRVRLPVALDTFTPDVLLLMEGTNDLNGGSSAVAPALDALTAMVRVARGRGIRVFLATVPPERHAAGLLVPSYNDGVAAVARQEGATLVDVYTPMTADFALIGPDGTHPTPQGFEVIAQTFFTALQQALELPPR
jgi:lysophospholipase L1-like esterase